MSAEGSEAPGAAAPGGARAVDAIVVVRELEKRYGDTAAVDGASFSIADGSIFGLLGPNGAGKTTTISMISCLIAPDGGDVLVGGYSVLSDAIAVRRVLGIVPQEIALYPTLTAEENLRFWGRMYGLHGRGLSDAISYGLEMAGLAEHAKKRVETFSGGMKRRINIAAGVLHRPKVLLMDEPTVGIDPQSRNHILETVRELNREGMTVVYTSHYMEEVEALCDRIAIVDHGKVIAQGTVAELQALVGDEDRIRITLGESLADASGAGAASDIEAADKVGLASTSRAQSATPGVTADVLADVPAPLSPRARAALSAVSALPDVTRAEIVSGTLEVLTPSAGPVLGDIIAAVTEVGADVRAVEIVEPNLESVFLHLTGRGLRD